MKFITSPAKRRSLGFSLPEVMISLGIITAITLPVLALLAGGGSMQNTAQDHKQAARIAHTLANSLGSSPRPHELVLHFPGRADLLLPLPSGDEGITYLAFDLDGHLLSEISEDHFTAGLRGNPRAHHLARLRLRPSDRAKDRPDHHARLCQLEISVAQPAVAALETRSTYSFHTTILAP